MRSCAKRAFDGPDLGRPRGRRLRSVTAVGGARSAAFEASAEAPRAWPPDVRAWLLRGLTANGLSPADASRPAIHSRISTACAVRSTSCSATSGAARDWPRSRRAFSPRVDVYYYGDPPKAVIKADLAGVDPNEVNLEVRGRALIISGERRPRDTEGRVYQQIEIEHGPVRARDPARRRRRRRRGAGHLRGRHPAGRAAAGRSARERTPGPDRVRRGTSRKRRPVVIEVTQGPGVEDDVVDVEADDAARRAPGPPAEGDRRLPEHDDAAGRRARSAPCSSSTTRSRRDRMLVMVASKDPEIEQPGPDDVYRVGVAGVIARMLKMPDGTLRILVQGGAARAHRRLHRGPSPTSSRASTRSPTSSSCPPSWRRSRATSRPPSRASSRAFPTCPRSCRSRSRTSTTPRRSAT